MILEYPRLMAPAGFGGKRTFAVGANIVSQWEESGSLLGAEPSCQKQLFAALLNASGSVSK